MLLIFTQRVILENNAERQCFFCYLVPISLCSHSYRPSVIDTFFALRFKRDDLPDDGFRSRTGSWRDPGLCLVDWGRGVDLSLFPAGTQFTGDSRTSGFRCIEMQENKLWTYQVDTYGLCVIVHMMLHGSYMCIEKKANSDGSYHYQPKTHLKRYWNVDLWKNLFSTLLNRNSNENDVPVLQSLRKSFEDCMSESPQLVRKLKELLAKQRASLCSA
ncbi:hypothetical protein Taro_048899 [Colocasia esculenta]|uniref:Uncharacterized protein n=1 Tax=Colocasia esculenta TaxID=4460 RepID=A0A843X9E8_COLES|nr:hypothetical protein [Colocasia esculenta]